MHSLPRGKTEADLRRLAGAALGAHLNEIPEYVPGEPAGLEAAVAAGRAFDFLEFLQALYRVKGWTRDELRRAFFEGALKGWRPETHVGEWDDSLSVVGFQCPIAELAERDPRACTACRAFQEAVAREALPGEIESVEFQSVLMKGDPECRAVFRFREPEAP